MKGHLAFITSFFEPFAAESKSNTVKNTTRGGSEGQGVKKYKAPLGENFHSKKMNKT